MATIETKTEQPTPFIHLRTTITQQSKGRVAETSVSIDFDPADEVIAYGGDHYNAEALMTYLQALLGRITADEIASRNELDDGFARITERLTHDRISQEEAI